MANTIHLQLLENKDIVAKVNGFNYTYQGGYKIIAGEENATNFLITSVPTQYQNARFTVEMVNSRGKGIKETTIQNNVFVLPLGMAVEGYGEILIRAYINNETVPWLPLKIKIWNTLPNWKEGITTETVEGVKDVVFDGQSVVNNDRVANLDNIKTAVNAENPFFIGDDGYIYQKD